MGCTSTLCVCGTRPHLCVCYNINNINQVFPTWPYKTHYVNQQCSCIFYKGDKIQKYCYELKIYFICDMGVVVAASLGCLVVPRPEHTCIRETALARVEQRTKISQVNYLSSNKDDLMTALRINQYKTKTEAKRSQGL